MTAETTSPAPCVLSVNLDDDIADGDPEAKARQLVKDAIYSMALATNVLAAELLSVGVVLIDPTQKTLAVSLRADGLLNLHINPEFVNRFAMKEVRFFLAHEAYHLLFRHLYGSGAMNRSELMTIAQEIVINHTVLGHLTGRAPGSGLPQVPDERDPAKSHDAIINPRTYYKKYSEAVKKKGQTPVDEEAFVASDLACYTYLCQIERPPKNPKMNFCRHSHGDAPAGDAGTDPLMIDPEQAGILVDSVLSDLMQKATNGDKVAVEAMIRLGKQIGEDHPMYGTLGLGALVGKTPPTAQVKFWEYFLQDAMASLMQPGNRMVFPRRLAGLEEIYADLGLSIPFLPQGKEPERQISIYLDCSGSMMGPIVERVASLVGSIPNAEVRWNSFDHDIYPFVPGEALRGGGGTSFQIIADHLAKDPDYTPDAVLVLTDGEAPHITPPNSDAWIWLVTKGGDFWPRAAGMQCIEVDL